MPIVNRLGYEHQEGDSVDTQELRTEAINQAASAGDNMCVSRCLGWSSFTLITVNSVIGELQNRFQKAMETGDDAYVIPDLTSITYTTVRTFRLDSAR